MAPNVLPTLTDRVGVGICYLSRCILLSRYYTPATECAYLIQYYVLNSSVATDH